MNRRDHLKLATLVADCRGVLDDKTRQSITIFRGEIRAIVTACDALFGPEFKKRRGGAAPQDFQQLVEQWEALAISAGQCAVDGPAKDEDANLAVARTARECAAQLKAVLHRRSSVSHPQNEKNDEDVDTRIGDDGIQSTSSRTATTNEGNQ